MSGSAWCWRCSPRCSWCWHVCWAGVWDTHGCSHLGSWPVLASRWCGFPSPLLWRSVVVPRQLRSVRQTSSTATVEVFGMGEWSPVIQALPWNCVLFQLTDTQQQYRLQRQLDVLCQSETPSFINSEIISDFTLRRHVLIFYLERQKENQ